MKQLIKSRNNILELASNTELDNVSKNKYELVHNLMLIEKKNKCFRINTELLNEFNQ